MQRQYELTLVFSPILTPDKREEIKNKLLKSMKTSKEEELGPSDLAYPIKKQTRGYFYRVTLEITPEEILKMKETLKIIEGILRYLIIKN